ncbi:hypothetical protein WIH36_001067 [Listeria monocytogenes]|nr:hypothetical protein [Listeria monocytogenes]EAH0873647.1 hypothetical protein [Listeria monocytogenes]EAH1684918.1 hypothetical protein [Listeria monocytogenes]EAH1727450.1 hypothetical protein [Listeria monocytogenes]EAH2983925.1 hypothetical protein [Listeria monocytogenes]
MTMLIHKSKKYNILSHDKLMYANKILLTAQYKYGVQNRWVNHFDSTELGIVLDIDYTVSANPTQLYGGIWIRDNDFDIRYVDVEFAQLIVLEEVSE